MKNKYSKIPLGLVLGCLCVWVWACSDSQSGTGTSNQSEDTDSSIGGSTGDTGGNTGGTTGGETGKTGGDAGGTGEADETWAPSPGTSWQWQLTETIDTGPDVQMYDVDLFDAPQETIDSLRDAGRIVICYFSAGTYEEWREDAGDFPTESIGNPLEDWAGEAWLDVRSSSVRAIMKARLDLAVEKRCDGVEPDNVDGYSNSNGHGLNGEDQLDYNRFLATQAHERGLSIGLKNDLDQVQALEPEFDWALNEECISFNECVMLKPFLDAGKAVFHVEYVDNKSDGATKAAQVCGDPTIEGFSTLIKIWDLDAWRLACP